jgi:hypothetical protein
MRGSLALRTDEVKPSRRSASHRFGVFDRYSSKLRTPASLVNACKANLDAAGILETPNTVVYFWLFFRIAAGAPQTEL